MPRREVWYYGGQPVTIVKESRYGFWRFFFDLFATCITGGLWLIYLIFRALRKN